MSSTTFHRLRRKSARVIFSAVIIAGAAARAIVPLGYMPGDLLSGELMALCPGASAATYELLHREDPYSHHTHNASDVVNLDSSCPIGDALSSDAIAEVEPFNATDFVNGSAEYPELFDGDPRFTRQRTTIRGPPLT